MNATRSHAGWLFVTVLLGAWLAACAGGGTSFQSGGGGQPPPAALAVATTSLPSGTVGVFYGAQASATGGVGPYTWSVQSGSLPSGLALNSSTGEISGTASTTGLSNFTLRVTDSATPAPTSVTRNLGITIAPASGPGSLGRNDTIANATSLSNGTFRASISPLVDPPGATTANPDNDIYRITANGGAIVTVETTAQRLSPLSPIDSVIELVDANGARLMSCRTPSNPTGPFNQPCMNDDISTSILDSKLEFQVPTGPPLTFYVRVLDWRGDARPDLLYTITIAGVN